MKSKLLLLVVLISQFFLACKKEFNSDAHTSKNGKHWEDGNPHLKIAIVSDIHYMHPSLLINNGAAGAAFQNYVNQDPKLVQFSDPIFRNVLADLKSEQPDILLVTGDITKDGEKIGHQAMARIFQ
jgi:predicted MPP superfamily phosphohydrolase